MKRLSGAERYAYARFGVAMAGALVMLVLMFLKSRFDPVTYRMLLFVDIGVVLALTFVVWLRGKRKSRPLARAWRQACEDAGLQPAASGPVLEVSGEPFPVYEGRVAGRDVAVAHNGPPEGPVWLYVRGEPTPGWEATPVARDAVETAQDPGWIGVAVGLERVASGELRRILQALASSVR